MASSPWDIPSSGPATAVELLAARYGVAPRPDLDVSMREGYGEGRTGDQFQYLNDIMLGASYDSSPGVAAMAQRTMNRGMPMAQSAPSGATPKPASKPRTVAARGRPASIDQAYGRVQSDPFVGPMIDRALDDSPAIAPMPVGPPVPEFLPQSSITTPHDRLLRGLEDSIGGWWNKGLSQLETDFGRIGQSAPATVPAPNAIQPELGTSFADLLSNIQRPRDVPAQSFYPDTFRGVR